MSIYYKKTMMFIRLNIKYISKNILHLRFKRACKSLYSVVTDILYKVTTFLEIGVVNYSVHNALNGHYSAFPFITQVKSVNMDNPASTATQDT